MSDSDGQELRFALRRERAAGSWMAIEIRQTKRAIVYRAVVSIGGPDSRTVTKTFRTRAAAEAWERGMIEAEERAASGAEHSDAEIGAHRGRL